MEEEIKNDLAGIAFSHPFFSGIVDETLNYIKKLEEENKLLTEKADTYYELYWEKCIPISVIQNKIDELKEKGKHIPNKGSLDYQIRQYNYIGCKIDILQELLEERNKKDERTN